jgi:catechol 2,3-dioxygenase-like lactoylglutathione lyase family enzyme
LHHVTITASDLPASRRFFGTVLGSLGIHPSHEAAGIIEWDDFSLMAAVDGRPATRHVHIGFVSPSRALVDEFWQTGIRGGYQDDGPPGPRPQYKPDYYGAFLLDPDGNSAEAVHHEDTRRGGHIDHLWIRVRDLGESERFYRLIARYTGLREGRRWDEGVQFRGAWATFSLVHDSRLATENLHIAFPAPDRETVEAFHRAATGAGYRDQGNPGERPEYHRGYYSAHVLDPDGCNVESVLHEQRQPDG